MPNAAVSSDDTSVRGFSFIGAAAAAYVPFVYGLWLILVPSDGTTKFGGILLISAGVAICSAIGSVVGAAIGLGCSLLSIRSKQERRHIRAALATIFALLAVYTGVSLIVRNIEGSTTRAFLITLRPQIEQFQRENGTLPASILDLNSETLVNPFQIEVSEITIERDGNWYDVVHCPSGTSVRYPLLGERGDELN